MDLQENFNLSLEDLERFSASEYLFNGLIPDVDTSGKRLNPYSRMIHDAAIGAAHYYQKASQTRTTALFNTFYGRAIEFDRVLRTLCNAQQEFIISLLDKL